MRDNPRVQELLDEVLDTGRTPEEVCADCPELLGEVRKRWLQTRLVEVELDAMFPTPRPNPVADTRMHWNPAVDLPRIPGYIVEAEVGRGGMGIVYKARHVRLNRPIALKMLLAGPYAGPGERERFLREAEAVACLRHANLVQVHDVGDHDGRPYFTMEYVEGGSLAQKLLATPQPARQAAALVATLAEAVQVAHQGGIVHRDLKPANILMQSKSEISNPRCKEGRSQASELGVRISDFIPKIADFGLARHFDTEPALTMSGTRVGTPSYMAPEQAMGKTHTIGPSVDIYALGAVLYELLTGRPPFRGETAAETELQVIYQDPVPPSRLNAKVPRDLETICLKCLAKDPPRRYASATALAYDLNRFLDGRPINARPLGWRERFWRWGRRNPAAAALLATALALVGLAIGGAFFLERQRAERREEKARQAGSVEVVLEQAANLQRQGRLPEARVVLEAAPSLLGDSAPVELHERVRQARADADVVAKLEEIRLRLSETRRTRETLSAERLYAEAFQNYGIPILRLEPTDAAERVRDSAIRETLLAFLYDWLHWGSDPNRDKLRVVLEKADSDGWRHEFREALAKNDVAKLKVLATAPEAALQPPVVLSSLGGTLLAAGQRDETLAMLREARQRHPDDFWINYLLGHFWDQERPQVAVGYFRAAVAIRPTSDQAHAMLGRALLDTGDTAEAVAAFRTAIALNPNSAVGQDMAKALAPKGGLEEARASWEKSLERDPPDHHSWHGYAELCLFLRNEAAYGRARRALLERFGETTNDWIIAERASLSCLLLPVSGEELRRAVALVGLAVSDGEKHAEQGNPYLRFVQGLAEYRQGRPKQAIPFLQESAGKLPNRPGPHLVLAMAQFQSGDSKEARKTLAAAIRTYNWSESAAEYDPDHPKIWASHVLRREAETMILPNLPAFLQGKYQPQDNDERLALLGTCLFQGHWGAAARLYADAFAADPSLPDYLAAECLRRTRALEAPIDRLEAFNSVSRYRAARCAALAGCGLGKDGAKPGEADRARLRKQACDWLQADLAAWAKMMDSDSRTDRDLARKMLMHWKVEPDLAGLRERAELDKLPADERKNCLALWAEVAGLIARNQK